MTFGERVKELRKARGVSQRELARRVGIDFTYRSTIENDRMEPPSEGTIRRIAEALDAEQLACARALAAPLVVAGFRVLVVLAGIQGDQMPAVQPQGHRLDVEGAEVDPQDRPRGAEQARELVQQAGLRPNPFVLDPGADLGQSPPVRAFGLGEAEQGQAERNLERRRGR